MRSSAMPVKYKRTIPHTNSKYSGSTYIVCTVEILYPVKVRNANTIQQENNIVGKKETPPKRGIARLCIFLSSGISNSFLRREIMRMRGIISHAIQTEITKAKIINI